MEGNPVSGKASTFLDAGFLFSRNRLNQAGNAKVPGVSSPEICRLHRG